MNYKLAEAWMMKQSRLPYEVNPFFTKPEEIARIVAEYTRCKQWARFWTGG